MGRNEVTMALVSGHLGNGLSIWREGTNDIVAHISNTRKVSILLPVTAKERTEIEFIAETDDRTISVTQDEKVFKTKPPIKLIK